MAEKIEFTQGKDKVTFIDLFAGAGGITEGDSCRLIYLDGFWDSNGEHSSETLPIYFGLMAIAGAYMIKNSFRYFFIKE